MTKQLSPLEALERLRPKTTYQPYYTRNEKRHYCDIIETALKEREKQDKYYAKLLESVLNDKEHKALEIIKEKNVNYQLLRQSKTFADYNKSLDFHNFGIVGARHSRINAEDFDLLKEELK